MNFYNENDPHAAQWLDNLIAAGKIGAGTVDRRSIQELQPHQLEGFTQAHFFAGIGGWDLALQLAQWNPIEPIWTGSCPCQPFSAAGRREGNSDSRDLWPDWFRLIRDCHPFTVVGEQVANAIGFGWLDRVHRDMEAEGYQVGAVVLGAHSLGAPHIRQRLFWVADATGLRRQSRSGRPGRETRNESESRGGMDNATSPRHEGLRETGPTPSTRIHSREQESQRRGSDGRLGDSEHPGMEERGDDGRISRRTLETPYRQIIKRTGRSMVDANPDGRESGQPAGETAGYGDSTDTAGGSGFWSAYDLIPCTDGNSRRIEPGTFPLVVGLPRRLGPIIARLRRQGIDRRAAVRNRAIQLRGYGNAIVPQVAAEFLKAFMELRNEQI